MSEEIDIEYYVSDKICLKKSEIHGLGVFAKQDIKEQEKIEVCKLLRLGWRMAYQHDPVVKDYCWGNMSCACEQCKIHGPTTYLALGYGSIYNHSDNPNSNISFDYKNQVFVVVASRDISNGEEIFVTYGDSYWKYRSHYLTKQSSTV
jgi:SET domain-containing protein